MKKVREALLAAAMNANTLKDRRRGVFLRNSAKSIGTVGRLEQRDELSTTPLSNDLNFAMERSCVKPESKSRSHNATCISAAACSKCRTSTRRIDPPVGRIRRGEMRATLSFFAQGTARILTLRVSRVDGETRVSRHKCKITVPAHELIEEALANDFTDIITRCSRTVPKCSRHPASFLVRQNLVEGIRGASAGYRSCSKISRFLTMRVLMVGCAAGAI